MPPKKSDVEQEKTRLRIKLGELSSLMKKFGLEFLNLESEKRILLLESQMSNRLLSLSNELESLESLEGKDGDIFVFFLKGFTEIVREVGVVSIWRRERHHLEDFIRILSIIRNLESQVQDFIPIVMTIDEKRKETNYETFGGLLQKLIDFLEEKRHMILGNVDENDVVVAEPSSV